MSLLIDSAEKKKKNRNVNEKTEASELMQLQIENRDYQKKLIKMNEKLMAI